MKTTTEKLQRLHSKGYSDVEIARRCGLSQPTVRAHRLGLALDMKLSTYMAIEDCPTATATESLQ